MPKNKSHKGLLKRVKVTKTGKIKLQRAYGRHLRSHKPGSTVRQYRRPKYARGPDAKRVRRMLGLKVGGAPKGSPGPATVETPTGS